MTIRSKPHSAAMHANFLDIRMMIIVMAADKGKSKRLMNLDIINLNSCGGVEFFIHSAKCGG
jgi:hypothetical protein